MKQFQQFPKDWQIVELGKSGLEIIDGDRGKNYPKRDEFEDEGFCLFLNTGNIKSDSFWFGDCNFITEAKDAVLRKGKLKRNDIILTTRGTIGAVAFYHDQIPFDHMRINSGMVVIRCPRNLEPEFIFLLLKSPVLKAQYTLYSSGAAQPQLPIKDMRRINLPMPPKTVQRNIAGILRSYDELIANNHRRIELLESMAESIFKEWFVRFRFPGYRTTEFKNGFPQDWNLRPFSELVTVKPKEATDKEEELSLIHI